MAPLKWTPEKQEDFLGIFAQNGNITQACQAMGLSRSRAYSLRAKSPEFAKRWEEAKAEAADALEAEARRRAVEGVNEPVYYKGEVVGSIRRYSDTLLIFLLKGVKPEKYTDRQKVDANVAHKGLPELLKRLDERGEATGADPGD